MNKIKLSLISAVSLLVTGLSLIFTSGCATGNGTGIFSVNTNGLLVVAGNTIDTNAVYNGIEIAAQLGANQAIKSDPNAVQYLQGLDLALSVLLNNGTFNPTELQNAVNATNVSQLKNPNTVAFMQAGVALYQGFYGNLVANNVQNADVYLAPALNGLQKGIEVSLAQNALAKPVATPVVPVAP